MNYCTHGTPTFNFQLFTSFPQNYPIKVGVEVGIEAICENWRSCCNAQVGWQRPVCNQFKAFQKYCHWTSLHVCRRAGLSIHQQRRSKIKNSPADRGDWLAHCTSDAKIYHCWSTYCNSNFHCNYTLNFPTDWADWFNMEKLENKNMSNLTAGGCYLAGCERKGHVICSVFLYMFNFFEISF